MSAVALVGSMGFSFAGHVDPLPVDYFDSPLTNELILAGNFAEMRSNHFHAGLDLKTQGREGLPVLAAAEGWVSRIKVSPVGYGNALYVRHPNGFTTVYGHLQKFEEPIRSYVRELQYKRQRFDLDVSPREAQFRVNRGDTIALSGNSGGSYAPHLHFEIRETASQTPINPQLFNLEIADSLPPRIFRVKLYPQGADSYVRVEPGSGRPSVVATERDPVVLDVVTGGGEPEYKLATASPVTAYGHVAFGIEANDYHDRSSNRLGAYRITLQSNGAPLYTSTMERVRFDQTRYINAHVDYAEYRKNRRWIQRSFALPGNRLPLYEMVEDGRLSVRADSTYSMRYVVEDAAGNLSALSFLVKGEERSYWAETVAEKATTLIPREEAFTFARNQLRVQFDANTFYSDQPFTYDLLPSRPDALSPVHRIHEDTVPLHKSMTVSIRAGDVPERLRSKLLLGTVDDEGNLGSAGGEYRSGFVVARPRSFGTYFIVADTVAPTVELRTKTSGVEFVAGDVLRFRVKDDLSGIGAYNAYIDGEWILLEYDPKQDEMVHQFVTESSSAKRKLTIEVDDNKGNQTTRSFDIVY